VLLMDASSTGTIQISSIPWLDVIPLLLIQTGPTLHAQRAAVNRYRLKSRLYAVCSDTYLADGIKLRGLGLTRWASHSVSWQNSLEGREAMANLATMQRKKGSTTSLPS